jgi:hypothetical protein
MKKIQLSAFLKISGIGSASGLVYRNNKLYIISDNSGFLYEYHLDSNQLDKHSLIKNSSENIPKKSKPDFESITLKGNELHLFGSGSTQNRTKNIIYNIETQNIQDKDLTKLYHDIKTTLTISDEELNIEGALFHKENLLLFQRGNGLNSKNGIIVINFNDNFNDKIQFIPITLPKIKHVETSFTDAILVDNKIYFLASAEDTISTYDDGEVLGSIIGCMDSKSLTIEYTQKISDTHKFEGLTLYQNLENEIIFLLCEDNDTEELQSNIYKLTINK